MSEENGADVNLEIGGQKVAVRNVKSLNTLATVATLVLVILLGYVLFEHKADAKQDATTMVSVLKEMNATNKELVQTQRTTNCLISLPTEKREQAIATCERISR